MRIQRYIAKDMRSALAQVRETLGPDAVILSSSRVGSEVEVVAAMDMEVARAIEHAPAASRSYEARSEVARAEPVAGSRHVEPRHAEAQPYEGRQAELLKNRRASSQLATLAWNDMSRRSPVQAAMLKELAQLGITQDLANSLVRKIPAGLSFSAARRFALATVARTIQVTGDRWLEKGGVVAFAGPAGAGKTTLLAKLAARWVLRHGPRRVALVSADAVRIGAHEQMHMLGRLLGVTTHNVFDVAELPELLYELRNCQFIIIDTAGASPRDPELARRFRLLNQMQASIETSLVLPASTQAGAIDEVVQRFELAKPSSCVITKVDEAVSLGGVLSALVRHKLPAAYMSDGQRVPEDLAPARAHVLVSRAVEIASHNGSTADDEVMQRRMAGVRNGRK
jgi:flagellar biosynthesis protein FlhF